MWTSAGYPLGGPDALVPKFGEQVLAALGIQGESNNLARLIRDPVNTIKGGPCSVINKPFG
jgi:hypothetical protein